jgi:hypothetical protein
VTGTLNDSVDVSRVVSALAKGLRSESQIARKTRIPNIRVRVALKSLVAGRRVIGSPDKPGTRFRLSDNGHDMLTESNAADRKRVR